jgi:hypothetical protein
MKKELIIYFGLFVFLALGMHRAEWLEPLEKLSRWPDASAYGFGWEHPFVFTLITYLILWIPRGIFKAFRRKKED